MPSIDEILAVTFWVCIGFSAYGWLHKIDGYVAWIILAVAIRGYW